ncbi:tetratricopeptide repeat protein [Brevibacillus fulvus]|uniref:Tetratricopeptide repeat protein n=1 Tax=Brevibacillus fulvus TaxID=1125967 RepID=A0A938XY79_9BACL|nr:hypothetical protein [Brevibacillus fulvus]MBM7589828.1 hypothetical protein [Brevibacillus fulvus]
MGRKQLILTLVCTVSGLFVWEGPTGELSAATVYAAELPDTQIDALVKSAFQQYRESWQISAELGAQLDQHHKQLLAVVDKGISTNGSVLAEREGAEQTEPAIEWNFWLNLAKRLNDPSLLPALYTWLSASEIPDRYLYQETLLQLIPQGKEQQLLSYLPEASSDGAFTILMTLSEREKITDSQLEQWYLPYRDKPQWEGFINFLSAKSDYADLLAKWYDDPALSVEQQRQIAQALLGDDHLDLLRDIAMSTKDIYTEQLIDAFLLRNHGDRKAAERLIASSEQNGFLVSVDGLTEKTLAELYPDSMLSKGIAEYRKIRGQVYFYQEAEGDWYAYQSYGEDFAQPVQAIAKWTAFLNKFPLHPAADDAAYRLARCYQQTGNFAQALHWFLQAQKSGDRDLSYDAFGQFLYVLDTEMADGRGVHSADVQLPAWTKAWIDYSQAVERLRQGAYAEANEALKQFLAQYKGKDLFQPALLSADLNSTVASSAERYPFWEEVSKQQRLANELANLRSQATNATGEERARLQYKLAALIYREPLLFYNHLWLGGRQSFFWFGQIKTMDYNETLADYIGRFNNYSQAIKAFSTVDLNVADPETAAKTLYSLALSNSKLLEYGEEVRYYASRVELGEQLLGYCHTLTERYPQSALADDALLLAYYYSLDRAYLQQVVQNYPQGDMVTTAKELLIAKQERANDPLRSYLPYQTVDVTDWRVPSDIKDWVEQNKQNPQYRDWKRSGDWAYIYIASKETEGVYFQAAADRQGVTFGFSRYALPKAWQKQEQVIRLPYRFIQQKSLVWEQN